MRRHETGCQKVPKRAKRCQKVPSWLQNYFWHRRCDASGPFRPRRFLPEDMAHGLVELITYRKIRVMQPDPLFGVAVGRALPYIPVPMTASSTSPVNSARADGRTAAQLRPVRFQNHIAPHATGSTLIEWGNTRVICGVMVEEGVPRWMKEQGVKGGWITAEYSMLPYATLQRKQRDISKGKLDGRSQEIQRLIGRSLRAVIDLEKLGQRTLWVDCDVLQADGGTRTAAITGTYVALSLAVRKLMAAGTLAVNPINQAVAAVSVGMVQERPLLDLCYVEDVAAAVDMNLVMTASGEFVELQGSGEESTFSETQLAALIALGKGGIQDLLALQKAAITQG